MVSAKRRNLANQNIEMKLSSQGQVTIPKHLRDELGIGPGDFVVLRRDKAGQLLVEGQRQMTVAEMAGSVPNRGKPFPDIREEWAKAMDDQADRILALP